MQAFAGCFCSNKFKRGPGYDELKIIAYETSFTMKEREVLYDLFKKLSSFIIDDGLLHKEEFQQALFRNRNRIFVQIGSGLNLFLELSFVS